jgi:AbiTii
MASNRRAEALQLAEELLSDIEYSRLSPVDIAKKASRLARLLDDADAMEWLRFEVGGYTPSDRGYMSEAEVVAARRSGRFTGMNPETGTPNFTAASLGWLAAQVEVTMTALAGEAGGPCLRSKCAARGDGARKPYR